MPKTFTVALSRPVYQDAGMPQNVIIEQNLPLKDARDYCKFQNEALTKKGIVSSVANYFYY